jgi:hypothetical protein
LVTKTSAGGVAAANPDAASEGELDILAAIFRRAIERYEERAKAAGRLPSPDGRDAKKGLKHEVRAETSLPR